MPNKIPSGLVIIVFVRLEIPPVLRDNLSLSPPLLLVFLNPFIFVNTVHKLTLLTSFLAKDFLKSCSAGRPTLKVLTATSSKSLSISLNTSQYLSEYVFRVSLSHMNMDNRESKGRGTLLHVIKRDPNTRVSSLKKSMEPAPRPSNHLIALGPKLEGNTLHIKALFLECTVIL